jgi:hypothetical protein
MIIAPLSVEEQERRLRQLYPDFRPVLHAGWIGIWEGSLRPIMQSWRVRIRYFAQRDFGEWHLANPYVTVTVVDPPLGRDPRGTGEPPPHVYRLGYPPDYPRSAFTIPPPANGLPKPISPKRSSPGRSSGCISSRSCSSRENGKAAGVIRNGSLSHAR